MTVSELRKSKDPIDQLAVRFWEVHPKEVMDLGISRAEFFAKGMRELVGKKDQKLALQKTDLARLNKDRSAHLEHILRLKRLLRNALDEAPGWRDEAAKEVLHTTGK